jgi:hypothetical protein
LTYAFIAQNQQNWPIAVLCDVCEVGRSGLYDYQRRQAAPSVGPQEVAWLERITVISHKTHHSYGSRRMSKQLQDEG